MKKILLLAILCGVGFTGSCQSKSAPKNILHQLFEEYTREFEKLGIASRFGLSYVTNLQNLPSVKKLEEQKRFFARYTQKAQTIDHTRLSRNDQYDYAHFLYELKRNQEQVALQLAFQQQPLKISDQGMKFLPKGWYAMYVKRMTTAEISPKALMKFGEKEVARIKGEIKKIQAKAGFAGHDKAFYAHLQNDRFNLNNMDTILARYAQLDHTVRENLHRLFEYTKARKVKIKPIPNVNYDSPPGYLIPNRMSGNTFYFKYYQGKHNWRAMDFLYIHEALPGHSYHFEHEQLHLKNLPAFHKLVRYPGFFEGWAAYVENLGKELGLYQNIYTEFGKWSWDLVRSVRIVLDAGIHHFGWSKQQAMDYWKKHLSFRMDIAQREIDRVTRWPAQVLSYKLGEAKLLELKRRCEQKLGKRFDIRKFHSKVISKGQIPLSLMETMVNDFIEDTLQQKLSDNQNKG
ncbi:hypothetical protein BKI52_25245 [marine bacterium AO1-C]|nr:hypothetical protein BKI52_25245 [marine bacterium AO1-C]